MSVKFKTGQLVRLKSPLNRGDLPTWLIGAVVFGTSLAIANGVLAADVSSPVFLAAADTTSTLPPLPSAANGGNVLEEITVTARRRNESLQDVPVAITVVGGNDWADSGYSTIQAVEFLVPGVMMNLSNPRQTQTAIRGLGMNPANNGLSGSVGYYVDGVYLDRPGMAAYDLTDLQQVEVLKGPQGTLFGKNTTAGALNIQTAPPTFKNEVTAETSFGTYGTEQFRSTLNGVIGSGNVLAVRASLYDDVHDGYLKATDLSNPGDAPNDSNRQGARLQFLYEPSSDTKIVWRSDYEIQHDNGGASILYSEGSPTKWAAFLAHAGLGANYPYTVGPSYTTDANASQNMMTRNYGTSVTGDWKLDGGYDITNITAFRTYFFRPTNDGSDIQVSSANLIPYYSSQAREHEDEFTQEVRFSSPTAGVVDYVVGGYYLWRREGTNSVTYYPDNWTGLTGQAANGSNAYLNGAVTRQDADPTTQSFAAFGQSNVHFNDQITLTTGLRETFEEDYETIIQYSPDVQPNAVVPQSKGPYNGSLAVYSLNLAELVTLSYKPTPSTLTYFTLSHGAKAAGFTTSPPSVVGGAFLPVQSLVVNPEKADNLEIGLKESLPEQHLTFDTDLFLTKIFGYQTNETVYVDGAPVSELLNAGSAVTKGFEAEAKWKPISKLTLSANGMYDLAYYSSFRNSAAIQGGTGIQDLTGQRMQNAPRWSGVLAAAYNEPLSDSTIAYGIIDYSWKDWQYGYADESSYSVLKSYGLTNLRGGININDKYDVSLYVTNLFNKAYFYSSGVTSYGAGYTAAPGDPRVAGFTIRAKF